MVSRQWSHQIEDKLIFSPNSEKNIVGLEQWRKLFRMILQVVVNVKIVGRRMQEERSTLKIKNPSRK